MSTILVGDIHLGKKFPFTNKKTAARWEQVKKDTLEYIWSLSSTRIQLGDLFDSFSVDASTFVQGLQLARPCVAVLAGNHDTSNNTEKDSAIGLLRTLGCTVASGESLFVKIIDGIQYIAVPHQLTQEKFEEALDYAASQAEGQCVLLLHCNYGLREGTQTENYLRPERAKELLTQFQYIISGHEHNGSSPQVGLRMLGSILPMNFGEMTDKYVVKVGECLCEVWSSQDNYRNLDYKDFLELPVSTPLQFIEISGCVDIAEQILISKKIVEWYQTSETLIAIKNGTTSFRAETDRTEDFKAADWVEKVMAQMSEAEAAAFTELLGE